MKAVVFEQVKEQVVARLREMNEENVCEVEKEIEAAFAFLKALRQLPFALQLPAVPAQSLNEELPAAVVESIEPVLVEQRAYKFKRKVKGGFLPELGAAVPETEVRNQELQDGDLVYAELRYAGDEATPPRYHYSVAERCGKELKDRVEFPFCVVEYDASLQRFFVQKTSSGEMIRIDGIMQSLYLPERDEQELQLAVGDIVDVAYLKSEPLVKRVVWKYDIKPQVPKRPAVKQEKEKKEKKELEPIFAGKTILMLGNEPEQAEFEAEVVNRGGKFLYLSGNENKTMMSAAVRKADAVIYMIQHVSHDATKYTTRMCKRYNKQFKPISSFGKGAFVQAVEELLVRGK